MSLPALLLFIPNSFILKHIQGRELYYNSGIHTSEEVFGEHIIGKMSMRSSNGAIIHDLLVCFLS